MIRSRRRDRGDGQALVEFALISVIFFLLLFGIIEGARAIYAYNTVANAARVGARTAIVNQDLTAVEAAVITEAVALDLTADNVTFTPCSVKPCNVTVTVDYDFESVTPLIDSIFDPTISSTAVMSLEQVNP